MLTNKSNVSLIKDLKTITIFFSILYLIFSIVSFLILKIDKVYLVINFIIVSIILVLIIMFLNKRLKYLDEIMNKTNQIVQSDMNIKIDEKNNNSFSLLAKNINQISQLGYEILVENIKNSIRDIHYIQTLVNNYDLDEDELYRELEIQKNEININKENVEIEKTINEIKNYYNAELEQKNIQTKIISSKENINIFVDRSLTQKIITKIFMDIIKYSLENTKIYIEIDQINEVSYLSIKSIYKDEIDINKLRSDKNSNLKYIEDAFYIQDIKVNVLSEASLFKIIIIIKN